MAPIRYGLSQRLTDAYQGWRDGHAEIPGRNSAEGPVTTPHREALIRLAQGAFAAEYLEYRKHVSEPHRAIMAGRARLKGAEARLTWERSVFDKSPVLTPAETARRGPGEERHSEPFIALRRRREHRRVLERSRAVVAQAQGAVAEIKAELDDAEQLALQHHSAAVTRVERIHEHVHRRLAVYRRALVRAHPDGAWANAVLSVRAPEIPTWALPLPDAHMPDGVRRPPVTPVRETTEEHEDDDLEPTRLIRLTHPTTRFGSALAPEVDDGIGYEFLDTPTAAPWHFTIVKTHDGLLELRTRGYGRGPYVGGEVVGSILLKPADFFDFADRRYTVRDADAIYDAPRGRCDVIADELNATSGSEPRLTFMSFAQRESTLLAVIGPSGAGKSSLMYALLGELPLGSGRLFVNKLPMTTHRQQIRERVGFVPQGTELHKSLTVEATLRYGFKLRVPARKARRTDAIATAMQRTRLEGKRHQPLSTLSGGEYRRVSIALELLTNPQLLVLDEPTSGLDANLDRQIMTQLREIAHEGRTVIVVTHATEHLYLADQVLAVVPPGTPAYAGPPRPMQRRFGFESYADFLDLLGKDREKLAESYRSGLMAAEARQEADELAARLATTSAGPSRRAGRARASAIRMLPRRFWVLTLRQCALLLTRGQAEDPPDSLLGRRLKNAWFFSVPLLIAAGSASLAALVAGKPGLGAVPSPVGPTALALLTTLCVLSGQALTYSDVVSELKVIGREFRAGVGALPVLAAKWLVYAVLAIIQAALITKVFCLFPDRAPQRSLWLGPQPDLFLGLAALSVAAMSLGMLVSTLATKLEYAVALVTATSIAQIALNGVTSDLSGTSVTSFVAGLLPDRWGLAAAASSVDLRSINKGHATQVSADALWQHATGQWVTNLTVLVALSAAYFVLAAWRLHARLRPPRIRAGHRFARRDTGGNPA